MIFEYNPSVLRLKVKGQISLYNTILKGKEDNQRLENCITQDDESAYTFTTSAVRVEHTITVN